MRYYFDTSIWIDIFEDRDESSKKLLDKIISRDEKVIYSGEVIKELIGFGYSYFEIKSLFRQFEGILIRGYATKRDIGIAKDLSYKRKVPKGDALHAILARNYKTILISRDKHFKKLSDIVIRKHPEDFS